MQFNPNSYVFKSIDWRHELVANNRKVVSATILIILVYLLLGLLLDVAIYSLYFGQTNIRALLFSLITFNKTPYLTLLLMGFTFISILVATIFYKNIALWGVKYHQLDKASFMNADEIEAFNIRDELTIAASLTYPPKLIIMQADFANAFAFGYSQKTSYIVLTSRLLQILNRHELSGVIAHEISHILFMDIRLIFVIEVLSKNLSFILDMAYASIKSYILSILTPVDNQFYLKSSNAVYLKAAFMWLIAILLLPVLLTVILLKVIIHPLHEFLTKWLNKSRETLADVCSIKLLRDNEALAKALIKINNDYIQNYDLTYNKYALSATQEIRNISYIFKPGRMLYNNKHSSQQALAMRLKAMGAQIST